MTPETVRYFGLMLACQARVAGMQAENQHALSVGNTVPYGDMRFFEEATAKQQPAAPVMPAEQRGMF